MKKIAILVAALFITSSLFGEEIMKGCAETKLTEATSIFSCPSGDFKVTFELSTMNVRLTSKEPKIQMLSPKPQTIIQAPQAK